MISPVGTGMQYMSPAFSIGRIFHMQLYKVCQIVKTKRQKGREKKRWQRGGEEKEGGRERGREGGRVRGLFITNV